MKTIRWNIAQYFEKRWWKNYLGGKDPVQYEQWKRNYWQGFLGEISDWVKPGQNQRFLDMGCGPAGIFMVLPGQVTALDPLLETYKTQLQYFEPESFKNVTFGSARVEDYICNDPFDIVFSLNVINHVADIKKAIRALYSCCKTGWTTCSFNRCA